MTGLDPRRPKKRWTPGALGVALPALVVFGFVLHLLVPQADVSAPQDGPTGLASAEGRRAIVRDTLRAGMVLSDLMASNGLEPLQIHEITRVVRRYKLPRTLQPGVVMRFSGAPGESPDRVNVQLNPDSTLRLRRVGEAWAAELQAIPFVVDTVRLSGVIESSLWDASLGGDVARLEENGFEELVYNLADVFAYKIDFTRDIRKGDWFRVAFERKVRPDGSVRSRQFLAIELGNDGRVFHAIPFARDGGRLAYFDTDGQALRGAFLRYPVPFRITSGFSRRRFHPILKRYRAHQGIDYGAPYGTRVQATGTGTVTRAGRAGAYGNLVEIRHANGIRTRYAHLSSIARGVRSGARVEQGDVIGRVGATGLATGTHLHYEFLQNGRHRNPLSVSVPAEAPLEPRRMEAFRRASASALALFEGLEIPSAIQVAQGEASSTDPAAR